MVAGCEKKGPGLEPLLRYRSFVGLKPHANPNDQSIDVFQHPLKLWPISRAIERDGIFRSLGSRVFKQDQLLQ